jgi:hypothetical protein
MQTQQQKRKGSLARLQASLEQRRALKFRAPELTRINDSRIKNLERMIAQTEAAINRGGN